MSSPESDDSSYLGRHTTLSYLAGKPGIWRRIPYLKDNDGRAPPIILAVGDRRRVYAFSRRLTRPVLLPEAAARLSHPRAREEDLWAAAEFGRVAMAIGLVSSFPVLVVETQMGGPATQIIIKEVLSDNLTSIAYRAGGKVVRLPHKVVIRVGSAGGINCDEMPRIKVGDVVNATHSVGVSGAVIQSILRLDFWQSGAIDELRGKWMGLGPGFSITRDGHPRVECSSDVVEAIDNSGSRVAKGAYCKGGNVTKDSLYAEVSSEAFLELCRSQNCRSTEMELCAIAVAASESHSHFGMVSGIVGLLPGASFSESESAKAAAERRSLQVALGAVRNLAS